MTVANNEVAGICGCLESYITWLILEENLRGTKVSLKQEIDLRIQNFER